MRWVSLRLLSSGAPPPRPAGEPRNGAPPPPAHPGRAASKTRRVQPDGLTHRTVPHPRVDVYCSKRAVPRLLRVERGDESHGGEDQKIADDEQDRAPPGEEASGNERSETAAEDGAELLAERYAAEAHRRVEELGKEAAFGAEHHGMNDAGRGDDGDG